MARPSFDTALAALLALALPPPVGLLAPAWAWLRRAPPAGVVGLILLAFAACMREVDRDAPLLEASRVGPAAVRLDGTWRQMPGRPPSLDTAAGTVALRLADDLRAPVPGTPVRMLARLDDDGLARVVATTVRGPPSGAWIDRWGLTAARRVAQLVHPERRGLVSALVLGDKSDLAWSLRRACIAAGVMHLLALSGLHVSLVATGLSRVLTGRGLGRSRVHGVVLLAFVLVAGARPPLVRALLGWVLLTFGRLAGRPLSPLRRLLSVAVVVLAADPSLRDDIGARLSFLGVAGLLAALRLPGGRLTIALAPAGAFLVTAPLCAELFGRVQPWGAVVTPLLAPLVGAILLMGLVLVLPGDAFSALDPVLAPCLDATGALLVRALEACEQILPEPLEPAPLPLPGVLGSLLVLGALLALGRPHPTRDLAT